MWKQPNKLINIEWIKRRERERKNQFWTFGHLFDHEKIIYTKFRAIFFTFSLFASKRKHWNDLDRFLHYSLVWVVLLRIWNAMAVRLIYKRNHLAARFTVHKTSTGSQHEYYWFFCQEFLFLTEISMRQSRVTVKSLRKIFKSWWFGAYHFEFMRVAEMIFSMRPAVHITKWFAHFTSHQFVSILEILSGSNKQNHVFLHKNVKSSNRKIVEIYFLWLIFEIRQFFLLV